MTALPSYAKSPLPSGKMPCHEQRETAAKRGRFLLHRNYPKPLAQHHQRDLAFYRWINEPRSRVGDSRQIDPLIRIPAGARQPLEYAWLVGLARCSGLADRVCDVHSRFLLLLECSTSNVSHSI